MGLGHPQLHSNLLDVVVRHLLLLENTVHNLSPVAPGNMAKKGGCQGDMLEEELGCTRPQDRQ